MIFPKNAIDCFLIWHLAFFSFKPFSLIFKESFLRCSSCSCKFFPQTTKSSWGFALTGTSKIIEVTSLWKLHLQNGFHIVSVWNDIYLREYQTLVNLSSTLLFSYVSNPNWRLVLKKKMPLISGRKFLRQWGGGAVHI